MVEDLEKFSSLELRQHRHILAAAKNCAFRKTKNGACDLQLQQQHQQVKLLYDLVSPPKSRLPLQPAICARSDLASAFLAVLALSAGHAHKPGDLSTSKVRTCKKKARATMLTVEQGGVLQQLLPRIEFVAV